MARARLATIAPMQGPGNGDEVVLRAGHTHAHADEAVLQITAGHARAHACMPAGTTVL